MTSKTVVVLGASSKEDRYSNKAVKLLLDKGHQAIPIHPRALQIHGAPCLPSLDRVSGPVDTLTLYLNPHNSERLIQKIIDLAPARLIMNPGAESELLSSSAQAAGIEVLEACTLVLLKTGQL